MLERIEQTIRGHKLIRKGMHIIAAVSGGADSVAMVLALAGLRDKLGFQLDAYHLNHGIRGRAADRDANAVARLCRKLNIACTVEKKSVLADGKRPGVSMEMAARTARLLGFRTILEKHGADAVAVAHHADDQAETVFMRLLSGSGLDGLGGMDYASQPLPGLRVIRPMLDVSRDEIEAYLQTEKQAWREDASNRDLTIKRNMIRQRMLPYLRAHGFPRAGDALIRLADVIRAENELIRTRTAQVLARVTDRRSNGLQRAMLMRCPVADQRRLLRAWLDRVDLLGRDIDFAWIEDLRTAVIGVKRGSRQLDPAHRISWNAKTVTIVRRVPGRVIKPVRLNLPGTTVLADLGVIVDIMAAKGYRRVRSRIGNFPITGYIRREDSAKPSLFARGRCEGDSIQPTGMSGSVKVKEVFINSKYPAGKRARYPLIVSGGQLVWVPGYRVDRRWAVREPMAASWKITVRQAPPTA